MLVTAIGLGLERSSRGTDDPSAELRSTAISAAIGLAAVDMIEVVRGRIRPVYLLDAALQVAIIVSWLKDGNSSS